MLPSWSGSKHVYSDEATLKILEIQADVKVAYRVLPNSLRKGKLTSANVKMMLQCAHIHGSRSRKQACFVFVKESASSLLTNPDAQLPLMKENPELWEELSESHGAAQERECQQ